jgi:hypothetical protein
MYKKLAVSTLNTNTYASRNQINQGGDKKVALLMGKEYAKSAAQKGPHIQYEILRYEAAYTQMSRLQTGNMGT